MTTWPHKKTITPNLFDGLSSMLIQCKTMMMVNSIQAMAYIVQDLSMLSHN